MAEGWTRLLPLPILVAALWALWANPIPVLNRFGGRLEHSPANTFYADHDPLNNGKCWSYPSAQACEDVRIHYPSGTAILACGYPETRNVWLPAAGRYDRVSADTYREYFVKYDFKTNTTVPLRVEGWDGDLLLHGLDILVPEGESSKFYIFAVNHDRRHEAVLVFSHVPGSDVVVFVREYVHPQIRNPNAVTAAGPSSFFITNDHYFYGGRGYLSGLLRSFEERFGPWRWGSDVVYCSASSSTTVTCQTVSPKHAHPHANGILAIEDGKALAVADSLEGTVSFYRVDPVSKILTMELKVEVGAIVDNLSLIPGSGDILVSVVINPSQLYAKFYGNILKPEYLVAGAVVRLVKQRNYAPEVVYCDDGSLISILTGAAIDPASRRLIASGVFERRFIVCDVSGVKF